MAFFKRVGHTYALRYEYTHKHNTLVCFGLSMSSIARLAAGAAGLLVVVSATARAHRAPSPSRKEQVPLRVVVTGCCGRIGKAVVAALNQSGHAVVGVDTAPAPETLRPLMAGFQQADLSVAGAADRAVRGADAVVHLAACPDDADFLEHLLRPNIVACVRLLDACRVHAVPRVIVASSGKVMVGYNGRDLSNFPLGATALPAPRDLYCATKLFVEAATEAHAHQTGAQCICVRFSWCPRTAADIRSMESCQAAAAGIDEYLSPRDAGRFVTRAVEAPLATTFCFETLYCCSKTPAAGTVRFDTGPALRLIGYQAQDCFPAGTGDIAADKEYRVNPHLHPGTASTVRF